MTAVIRRAEAVLQAAMMMSSSMTLSLMSPGAVVCKTKTARKALVSLERYLAAGVMQQPTLASHKLQTGSKRTIFITDRLANRDGRLLIRVLQDHDLAQLITETTSTIRICPLRKIELVSVILVSHQLGQLGMAVAGQQLDGVECHCGT